MRQVPHRVARLFDFVEEYETDPGRFGVVDIQRFPAQSRTGFAVSEISGRRADQLGNFVALLELSAIDLEDCVRIAQQRFGSRNERS